MRESKKSARHKLEVVAYDFSNERVNALMDDNDVVWIVQGSAGRRPLIANTKEDAAEQYLNRFYEEPEEEFV